MASYGYQVGKTPKLPGLELAAEDYRKLTRLAKRGEVRLEIDSRVHFEDADHNAYNILADIPGDDPHAGYVMAGAHLDSWVAGDGAADNGAGSAVIMEAARILASLGTHPKRTIRFALWAGEEEGLLGSEAYVEKHLAHRPQPTDPAEADLPPYFLGDLYPVRPCRASPTWRVISTSTMAREKFAASTRREIPQWCRFCANGCRLLPAWARA